MNTKREWIAEFEVLLLKGGPTLNKNNPNYSYQLATAYFDWNSDCTSPECTPQEAYQRYLEN
jgi:hypothetical protein